MRCCIRWDAYEFDEVVTQYIGSVSGNCVSPGLIRERSGKRVCISMKKSMRWCLSLNLVEQM